MGTWTGWAYEGTLYVPTERRKPITCGMLWAWLRSCFL
jgi:hypothetical protein